MTLLTDLSQMWLTRSRKPFVFTNDYDQVLDYRELKGLGLYVHIPFCRQLCNFCPYCKTIYSLETCNKYIDHLLEEIHLVARGNTEKKPVTSLYFGGGTPALAVDRIQEIIDCLGQYFIIQEGIGLELHPENVRIDVLEKLREAGVSKISIGIQSFQEKFQILLGRKSLDLKAMETALKKVKFETVSMDFIFALPGQKFQDLKEDIDLAFSSGANHIAIYPFIDFSFTDSPLEDMGKKEKRKLFEQIRTYCLEKGYRQSSIWTYGTDKAHYSSMTRDNFLGFGCSATSLLKDQFKVNTFSIEEYGKRVQEGKLPSSLTTRMTLRQRMIYYLFWTAYSTKISKRAFEEFFNKPLKDMYGFELTLAKLFGFLEEEGDLYTMTTKGAFYYHYYESFYTLAYIDKMWGIMRKEAFPKKIIL